MTVRDGYLDMYYCAKCEDETYRVVPICDTCTPLSLTDTRKMHATVIAERDNAILQRDNALQTSVAALARVPVDEVEHAKVCAERDDAIRQRDCLMRVATAALGYAETDAAVDRQMYEETLAASQTQLSSALDDLALVIAERDALRKQCQSLERELGTTISQRDEARNSFAPIDLDHVRRTNQRYAVLESRFNATEAARVELVAVVDELVEMLGRKRRRRFADHPAVAARRGR